MEKYIINPRFADYEDLVRQLLPGRFDSAGQLIYDSRNKVRDIETAMGHIIVKKFRRPPLHQRIDYTLRRPSKAQRAYRYGVRLDELGLSTPTPIACVETYRHGLFTDGYVVTLPCYDPDLRILRREPDSHPDLINALMTFMVNLHQHGFMHGDTNLSNFLYRPDDSSPTHYRITTIDINRSVWIEHPTQQQCLANLMRQTHIRPLLASLVERYAQLRGWDVEECVKTVMHLLNQFEKRKRLLNRLKLK
ncbi:MAG: hypothetical protein II750_02700 [Bacteroidaceae bacterium]|nr:hypothetical protein [Bacteroidaceae bacterium]